MSAGSPVSAGGNESAGETVKVWLKKGAGKKNSSGLEGQNPEFANFSAHGGGREAAPASITVSSKQPAKKHTPRQAGGKTKGLFLTQRMLTSMAQTYVIFSGPPIPSARISCRVFALFPSKAFIFATNYHIPVIALPY